jgi:hypothetical protein
VPGWKVVRLATSRSRSIGWDCSVTGARGLSLPQLAKAYKISWTNVARALKQSHNLTAADVENAPNKQECRAS